MKKPNVKIGWVLAALLLIGCSATKSMQRDQGSFEFPVLIYGDNVQVVKYPISLSDFLERAPGVQVSAKKVVIRGQFPPLYVVDDVLIGNDLDSVEQAVSIFDIQSVEVVTDLTRLARYGSQGVNGVILIRTKMPTFQDEVDSVAMDLM